MARIQVDPALAELCRQEHVHLVGLIALYVGDRAVAEELARETLVRLHQHWRRVRAAASPHAWITTVALDLSRSWWQRRRAVRQARRRAGAPAASIPEPAAAGPVAAERVGDEPDPHEVEAVRAAVLALPAQQRAALLLRHYAGLPVDETAAALGCTAAAVKSLTHSAVNALRLALDDIDDMIELEEVLDG